MVDQQIEKWTPPQMAYIFLRYTVVFWFLFYGFAKLFGAQFTILDSELDKPLGQVSGFWLTWYYFGYSSLLGTTIALVQIAGAILLMFRKTTLLAACILLPAVVNIILVDISFRISLDATVIALYLLTALLCISLMHGKELLDVFWQKQNNLYPPITMPRLASVGKWMLRIIMVALLGCYGYYLANYNNRLPTPIDGAWQVISVQPAGQDNVVPAMIFFEYNRAWQCVFKLDDGTYHTQHFEVDRTNHSINIWQDWIVKGPQLFSGHYDLSGSGLTLTGVFTASTGAYTIHLMRKNIRSSR